MSDKKIESLAYRLKDYESLRALFAELNFEFADEPVNKEHWNQDQIDMVQEAKIIAIKDDYRIYYIQTNTDSLNQWKGIATKIIKENNGLCLICSHNPSGFKWVFSSLSKDFSKSFTETRHVPIDIRPDSGVPQTFVEFLEKIKINKDSTASSIASQISEAFDSFAVTIHDELTVNVFEALKSLSEGIILDESNDLTLDEKTLEEIREPIFILLYRIIFILYAEDRGIFPTEQKIYHEKFSFKWLKQEWLLKSDNQKKLSEYKVHERLWNFFRLIELGSEDLGYDSNEFFMRSYYGRIFDRNINQKLDKWKIKNQYLLDAIGLLTRTRDKNNNYFFLDYSALETRHLGSIYEHLLEYHLTVKGKKIADLPNQKERKSSGSYYTPQYIVDYVVQNTIEPLIDKIRKDTNDKFEQIEKILSLNIVDPSMGSGHFLVGAVNYVAKRICEIENGEIKEYQLIDRKRDVARRCIYGVDINPLAVDLAMVSLWLDTLSSERPLSFFSAHLKCGNSLIGSEIETLFDKQTTLIESQKGREKFKKTIKDFIMLENLEDDSANAVKTKIEKYENIQSKGTIYYDLKYLLDCKSAEYFGIKVPALGDYRAKIGENSLDFFTDNSLKKVRELSNNQKFFHWNLEFPDIFFDENGERKSNPGFDVVIGNPPYGETIKGNKDYFKNNFHCTEGKFEIYKYFFERGLSLLKNKGVLVYISPDTWLTLSYFKKLREMIIMENNLKLISQPLYHVFEAATVDTMVSMIEKDSESTKLISVMDVYENILIKTISREECEKNDLIINIRKTNSLISKLDKMPFRLNKISEIWQGLIAYADKNQKRIYSSDKKETPQHRKLLFGSDISKYSINWSKRIYLKYGKWLHRPRPSYIFDNEKILVQRIRNPLLKVRIVAAYDQEKYVNGTGLSNILILDAFKKKFPIKVILGIINSSLINYWFSYHFHDVNIKPEQLRKIPISIDEKIYFSIKKLVDQILCITKDDYFANPEKQAKVKNLEKTIDQLVYNLYELTPEEIKIVENFDREEKSSD